MFEITQLKQKKLSELQEIAEKLKISKFKTLKKLDLVYKILDYQASNPDINEQKEKTSISNNKTKSKTKSFIKKSENFERKTTNFKKLIFLNLNRTAIKIKEIDTKNLTMSLMQLSRVKEFLI